MSCDPPLSPSNTSSLHCRGDSPLSPAHHPPPCSVASRDDSPPLYRGVRRRKWGKWVAEIRGPHKKSRIWLGSYFSAHAAAQAFDVATYCLRGPSAKMNLPHLLPPSVRTLPSAQQLSPKSVQKLALAAGSAAQHSFGNARISHSPNRADTRSRSDRHSHASSSSSASRGEDSFKKPRRLSIVPALHVAPIHWMSGAELEVSPHPTIAQLADAMLVAPPSLNEQRCDEDVHVDDFDPSDSSLWHF